MEIKYGIVVVWKYIMKVIYFFFKFLSIEDKVTFMSRQTNDRNLDFDMLIERLKIESPNTKIIILNRKLEKGIKDKIFYGFHMFKQMYHMATSKVIILDGYSILISILNQKRETKVIQIWHALGSLKKFGYSILDKREGRNKRTAEIMNMHKNYDYIITSSEESKKHIMEAFNVKEEQMIVLGLPRMDFLQSKDCKKEVRERFYKIYKECDNNKKNILYVPTYRKNKEVDITQIGKAVDYDKYNLIIKIHDGRELVCVNSKKIEKGIYFLGTELLHIADYVITDYSAIVYEAAIANKPIYFYTYDYEQYMKNRGIYINYKKEMPGYISNNIKKLIKRIEAEDYDLNKVKKFSHKYTSYQNLNITKELVNIIIKILKNEEIK